MCVIIDTNTFASVFNPEAQDHKEFQPVYDWIINKKGKIVFGGSKYKEELSKGYRYLKLFGHFSRARKTVEIDQAEVDKYQEILINKIQHRDFDDPHLVAIAYISKCRVICTNEKRAIPYLTLKNFYPNNSPRPKIYTQYSNKTLLCDRYYADICKPCIKLNKVEALRINQTKEEIMKK